MHGELNPLKGFRIAGPILDVENGAWNRLVSGDARIATGPSLHKKQDRYCRSKEDHNCDLYVIERHRVGLNANLTVHHRERRIMRLLKIHSLGVKRSRNHIEPIGGDGTPLRHFRGDIVPMELRHLNNLGRGPGDSK